VIHQGGISVSSSCCDRSHRLLPCTYYCVQEFPELAGSPLSRWYDQQWAPVRSPEPLALPGGMAGVGGGGAAAAAAAAGGGAEGGVEGGDEVGERAAAESGGESSGAEDGGAAGTQPAVVVKEWAAGSR
jgi:hypothetical protein